MSPHAFFVTMTLGTIVFLIVAFIPMCIDVARGYIVKFSEDSMFFKGKKFQISEIEKIETFKVFDKSFKFIFKNDKNFWVPSGPNKDIAKYIESRFFGELRR